jgi:superfamily I DNA/RNA helicase
MEVKDVLSMLRFVCNPKDGISFARIANKPARGMGDALIGRLEHFAEKHDLDLMRVMSEEVLPHVRDEHDKPLSEAAVRACRETRGIFVEASGDSAQNCNTGFQPVSGDALFKEEKHGLKTRATKDKASRPDDVVNLLLDGTKYDEWLKARYDEPVEYESRRRNVNELANSIASFSRENPDADVA